MNFLSCFAFAVVHGVVNCAAYMSLAFVRTARVLHVCLCACELNCESDCCTLDGCALWKGQ